MGPRPRATAFGGGGVAAVSSGRLRLRVRDWLGSSRNERGPDAEDQKDRQNDQRHRFRKPNAEDRVERDRPRAGQRKRRRGADEGEIELETTLGVPEALG